MEIRKYKNGDLDGVISTWENASKVGHYFLDKDFINSERKNIPAKYLPNGDCWVAEEHNLVIGFMILQGNEVGALFVDPKCHGEGVGYSLMNIAQEQYGDLRVEVFKQNSIGRKFYSRYGFNLIREYHHKESDKAMLCLSYSQSK